MVFHWSLSDNKPRQVSRALLRILAVLNNVVVWRFSTRPPTSKSSSPFSNPLVTVPNAPITIGIIVACMFHSFFNSLARSRYLSFSFILWSAGTAKSTILQVLFFFVDYYKVWFSGRDLVICVHVKVPLGFICVIFLDRCWVVHIPFVRMVKSKFLAHLPGGSPCRPSRVSSYIPSALICCIHLLCDWWFHLCHRIAYICYFVASYQFSLWYYYLLQKCFSHQR